MKKTETEEDELRPEYDLSQMKVRSLGRGRYVERYREGTNLVLLAPDVAEVFPDADSVNEALRSLIRMTKESQDDSRQPKGED